MGRTSRITTGISRWTFSAGWIKGLELRLKLQALLAFTRVDIGGGGI
jgi:hypothetical protein